MRLNDTPNAIGCTNTYIHSYMYIYSTKMYVYVCTHTNVYKDVRVYIQPVAFGMPLLQSNIFIYSCIYINLHILIYIYIYSTVKIRAGLGCTGRSVRARWGGSMAVMFIISESLTF